jgi:hypothetical protein
MSLFNEQFLVIADPMAMRFVFEDPNFHDRLVSWPIAQAFENKGIIFTNDKNYHRLHRTLALKGLMKTNILKNTTVVIHEKVALFLKDIENATGEGEGKVITVSEKLHSMALDIIGNHVIY